LPIVNQLAVGRLRVTIIRENLEKMTLPDFLALGQRRSEILIAGVHNGQVRLQNHVQARFVAKESLEIPRS
jgi:hypothetical protein